MNNIHPLVPARSKVPESEKVTINLGYVDLGHVDLLVAEGWQTRGTDCIRTAIRNKLAPQSEAERKVVARKMLVLGLQRFSRADLEAIQAAGETLDIRVLGLASIDEDVPAALAQATIASVTVLGAFQASAAVKAALAGRIG